MQHLQIKVGRHPIVSKINVGTGLRHDVGPIIKQVEGLEPHRVAIVTNRRVYRLYGKDILRSLKAEKFDTVEWLMGEGERFKSFSSLQTALKFLAEHSFERNDLVLALGGGVVGDLAGFAAALYLRGIPLIQVPTTLLAQIDSSVGGKTGINLAMGKNLVGAFHQPAAVVIDTETLTSLPKREWVAGLCEMVKQALIADRSLFNQTLSLLRERQATNQFVSTPALENLIAAHCKFKASIVAGDERESIERSDHKSRKILNFGHTTAHALEAVTGYRVFRHGEAVGYGLLVAGEISARLGMLPPADLESLRESVKLCGPLPRASHLDTGQIMSALKHDKKSKRGEINWVLLERIGSPSIVPGHKINRGVVRDSLRKVLRAAK